MLFFITTGPGRHTGTAASHTFAWALRHPFQPYVTAPGRHTKTAASYIIAWALRHPFQTYVTSPSKASDTERYKANITNFEKVLLAYVTHYHSRKTILNLT